MELKHLQPRQGNFKQQLIPRYEHHPVSSIRNTYLSFPKQIYDMIFKHLMEKIVTQQQFPIIGNS